MSSTNRSNKRDGHRDDYYVTPPWCVREFLRFWDDSCQMMNYFQTMDRPPVILDPCAGGDQTNPMTYPMVLQEWGLHPISMDIRMDSPCMFPGTNFLTEDLTGLKADMVITNPPYNLAVDIINKSMEVVRPMGWVVMLLRLNFLGSQRRGRWYKNQMPHSVFTHSKRPGFYPDNWRELMPHLDKKGTDSCEYAHFVWQKVSTNTNPYQGYVIPHVKGVSDAPGPYYAEAA